MTRPVFPLVPVIRVTFRRCGAVAIASVALMLGACAGSPLTDSQQVADTSIAGAIKNSQSELDKATMYWSKEYAKDTKNLNAALSYAKNLKAAGQKERALAILQEVSIYHGSDRALASEYGRLALDMGQVGLAEKLLAAADDPTAPDWRLISARGTVFAKQGKYSDAIPHYERALVIAPDASSVLSNLAMAYAAGGRAAEAEPLLRHAIEVDGNNAKLKQNLALVMGLQGKHNEAKQVEGQNIAMNGASDNADLVKQMVKVEPAAGEPAQQVVASADLAKAKGAKKSNQKTAQKAAQPDLRQAAADAGTEPNWDKLVATAIANSANSQNR
jgi:Flp pilus assembly protein TadD